MTALFLLERDGVGVLVDARGTGLPRVLHWGDELGALDQADLARAAEGLDRQSAPGTLDAAEQLTVMPAEADGWSGRPGMQLRREGRLHTARWTLDTIEATSSALEFEARDASSGLALTQRIALVPGGLVLVDAVLRHDGGADAAPVEVEWLEATLPVPTTASHLTTFDGRWSREKRPVTTEFPAGSVARQSRRGRPGHDAATMLIASEGEPRWRSGRVWASHIAWPSDTTHRTDRVTDSLTLIGGGALLRPGELVLAPGETYAAPTVVFSYAEDGLDAMSARVHDWLRSRPQHPRTDRRFTLNTWEAVYFDQDPARLIALAERAAEIGVERFVLDDGWFAGRNDDTTSLGDWIVDARAWPDGLGVLADRVHALGMQFGLWFEPEMISLDSDLARAHPEWLLHDPRHLDHDPSLSWRSQYVLDLANADAWTHILEQMSGLVAELGIDYIKWDHNRDLVESVHDGIPGTHAQTTAVLRLIAALKERHPGLEIESCSSGGARTDLGILQVTDRVWASDSNDPVERQDIQRWTGLLLPPELVGAHVGPTASHSSGRVTDLSYRIATSLLGCAGLEWDILGCDADETAALARFTALYRELRPIVHGGRVVHPDLRDPAWRVTGHVTPDAAAAVFVVATIASVADARAERLRFPGLDPDRRYRVRVRNEIGRTRAGWILPSWMRGGEITLPGSVLERVGLQLPTLWPAQALVLHLTAVR
ncbi:alpha-galactosidase [Microbacterium sp. CIAB417]|uniref:alpha-galactosidase n=1 Tax=Microbacterium sp. CIAB417 TaxID=2860287 RepID=UPI001FAC3D83|nr:alpha-galactosidase [Microbacterium sp. CIAB417]